jgi:glutathione synthase/RimK-type ligase-like ATP-grasp enzyme
MNPQRLDRGGANRPLLAIASYVKRPTLRPDDRVFAAAVEAAGLEPVAVVWDDAEQDWTRFDACVLRSVSDYPDKQKAFVDWVSVVGAEMPFWNPPGLANWNLDKTYLRQLERRGVPVVPSYWLEQGSCVRLDDVLDRQGWEDAVLKPTVDLGAKSLSLVHRGQPQGQEILQQLLGRNGVMIQPFLPSVREDGETSFVYIDSQLTHVVRKRPKAGDFRVQGNWGGTVESAEVTPGEVEVAQAALDCLDERPLYARVDLVLGPDRKPSVIELELIEPILYFEQNPEAAQLLAVAIAGRLRSS